MKLQEEISEWLKNYLVSNDLKCFIVGISGGIDSALTSTLCAITGIHTVVLSLHIDQNVDQIRRANLHIKWLKERFKNVESLEYDLTQIYEIFKYTFTDSTDLALANSKSRLRMVSLYHVSSMRGGIVVGTGNKIEDFGIGFFTKYGDGGVDISPIADLKKSEVNSMARDLGIVREILEAKPTDGLWDDNRDDETQIGATYDELEKAMDYEGPLDELSGREKEVYEIYIRLNKANKHKMVGVPIFKKR